MRPRGVFRHLVPCADSYRLCYGPMESIVRDGRSLIVGRSVHRDPARCPNRDPMARAMGSLWLSGWIVHASFAPSPGSLLQPPLVGPPIHGPGPVGRVRMVPLAPGRHHLARAGLIPAKTRSRPRPRQPKPTKQSYNKARHCSSSDGRNLGETRPSALPTGVSRENSGAYCAIRAQRNCGASCASIGSSSVSFIAQVRTW